jgi:hypothetical protein
MPVQRKRRASQLASFSRAPPLICAQEPLLKREVANGGGLQSKQYKRSTAAVANHETIHARSLHFMHLVYVTAASKCCHVKKAAARVHSSFEA